MTTESIQRNHSFSVSPCSPFLHSDVITGKVTSHAEPLCSLLRVLYVGGNSNTNTSNATQYGVSYANANNNLTNSNTNIGSRLNFVNPHDLKVILTLPMKIGRTQESTQPGSVTLNVKIRDENKGHENMRHRINNRFETICRMSVLEKASANACSPRNGKKEVYDFLANKDELLKRLQSDIIDHKVSLSEYNIYYKMERGKKRLIADLPLYPDRILHCAIAIAIEDELNKKLIHQTHASIKDHGTHTLMIDFRRNLHNNPKLRYCLSMDVDQFYASIPMDRAKLMFREYIKDDELLYYIDRIIDNYNDTGHTGLPLGGRLSPLIANLYLNGLDHYMKEKLHCHVMGRYMDNIYVLGNSKPWLHQIEKEVVAYLGELGLRLNPNTSIRPIDSEHGVDMVGWVVYSDHVLIRKKTKLKMKRGFQSVMEKLDRCMELDEHDYGMIHSYVGSLKWFDSYNLRRKIIDPVLDRIDE